MGSHLCSLSVLDIQEKCGHLLNILQFPDENLVVKLVNAVCQPFTPQNMTKMHVGCMGAGYNSQNLKLTCFYFIFCRF